MSPEKKTFSPSKVGEEKKDWKNKQVSKLLKILTKMPSENPFYLFTGLSR